MKSNKYTRNPDNMTGRQLSAEMMEYKNIHDRVASHLLSCSNTVTQIIIAIGGLLIFSISNYNELSKNIFVDITMCSLLPVLSLGILYVVLATNIKILAFGEYLATVEKRINKTLSYKVKNGKVQIENIVDWERWRLEYGYANDNLVFYDSAFVFVFILIGSILSPIFRVFYINENISVYSSEGVTFWLFFVPLLYILMFVLLYLLNMKLKERKARLQAIVNTSKIDYGEKYIPNRPKKYVLKIVVLFTAIYFLFILLILATFQFSFFNISASVPKWLSTIPIAHRGLHTEEIPENTLKAFTEAIDNGYAIELDIINSLDNVPIIFHDDNMLRLCGIDKKIDQLNYSIIETLRVNGKEKIPSLKEVLDLVDGRTPLLIELKNNGLPGFKEKAVFDLLKDYAGEYAVQSYNPLVIGWVRKNYPAIIRGQLYADWGNIANKTVFSLRDNLFNLLASPNFVGYDRSIISYTNLAKYRDNGLKVLGWLYYTEEVGVSDFRAYYDNIIFESAMQ